MRHRIEARRVAPAARMSRSCGGRRGALMGAEADPRRRRQPRRVATGRPGTDYGRLRRDDVPGRPFGCARRRAVSARSRAPRHRPARRGRFHRLRQAARKAGGAGPICPIIFLTAAGDIDSRLHGFEQGAVDYIVKPFHIKELLARIKVHLHEDEQPKGDVPSPLTEREREVKLLASGKTYKQVAHALQVSQSTIRNHLHNVYHKLEVVRSRPGPSS